jgi:hypothetical protein
MGQSDQRTAVPSSSREESTSLHAPKTNEDLIRENEELKELVIQLTKIVVRNVMERA